MVAMLVMSTHQGRLVLPITQMRNTHVKHKNLLLSLLTIPALLLSGVASPAAAQGLNVIRDAEMEDAVKQWTAPIIRAAGMQPDQIKFIFVQSDEINAFVAGGANVFIYTGLIDKTDSPLELLGVIAHEIGHIKGGHLTRSAALGENLSYEMILGAILGGAAAVLSGDGSALVAGTVAGQATATNAYLAHSRVQEATADQSGVTYLNGAHISSAGMLTFLSKLQDQELLPVSQQSGFMRTHPVTRERIENLKMRVGDAPNNPPPEMVAEYKLIKAKLVGFTKPQQVEWFYPRSDTSLPARYARAISAYRTSQVQDAAKQVDALLDEQPDNPYFNELKGQMLFDFGRIRESIPPYAKAVKADPQSGLLRIAYAQSIMEADINDKAAQKSAIEQLKRAVVTEDRSIRAQRLLATAYGRLGMGGQTSLHLAEQALLQRRNSDAAAQAKRALDQLPVGSPDAIKASDILALAEQGKKD